MRRRLRTRRVRSSREAKLNVVAAPNEAMRLRAPNVVVVPRHEQSAVVRRRVRLSQLSDRETTHGQRSNHNHRLNVLPDQCNSGRLSNSGHKPNVLRDLCSNSGRRRNA